MASAVIGALRVNLGLDSAEFETGAKKAKGDLNDLAKSAKAMGLAMGAAFAAATTAITAIVMKTSEAANATGDMADRLGVGAEALQELRHAADRGGMGMQNFDVALRRFIRRSSEAAQGTGAAKDAFKELGIQLTDGTGKLKDTESLLAEVADAMQRVENPADKLRLAFKMFDTDGAAMVNVLAGGSAGLAELREEARKLGIVLDEDTIRSAQKFHDNLDTLRKGGEALANSITTMALPAFVAITGAAINISAHISDASGALIEFGRYAAVAASALAGFFAPAVFSGLASVSVAIGTTMVGAVRALTAAMLANPLGLLIAGIAAAVTAIFLFRDEIKQVIGVDVVAVVKDAANRIIGAFVGAYEAVKQAWNNLPTFFGAIGKQAWNSLLEGLSGDAITWTNPFTGESFPLLSLDFTGAKMNLSEEENRALRGAVATFDTAYNRDYIGELKSSLEGFTSTAEGASAAITDLGGALDGNGTGGGAAGGAKKLGSAADDTGNRLSKLGDIGKQIGSTLANSFTDMFMSFIEGGKSAIDIVADLLKSLAKLLLNNVFQSLFGGLFGGGGFLGGLFGGGGGIPGFANGTRSAPGGLAWVGERGRELVNLPRGSQVIPNSKIGTGTSVVFTGDTIVNVEGSTGDPQRDATYTDMVKRAVEQAVDRRIAENMRVGGLLKPRL